MADSQTQNKSAEINFFDQFGEQKDYDVFSEKGYERIINEFLKHLIPLRKSKPKLKIIDLGCGTGAFTAKFANRGFELYGMDISKNCIEFARANRPQIKFEIGDIENTQLPDESFDVIFLSGVVHHFPDFSNLIKECYRILSKDGVILAYDPNKSNPFMYLYRCKESPFYSSKGVTENENPIYKKSIREVLVSNGFKEVEVYSISGITYKYIDIKLAFLILPIYNLIEKILDLKPLRKRFGSFNISYAKK